MPQRMVRESIWRSIVVVLGAMILVLTAAVPGPAQAPPRFRTGTVQTHMSRGTVRPVLGAAARALVSTTGVTMTFNTRELVPAHVYTAWWVVVNKPSACASLPCTPADVLTRTEIVEADIGYADGAIADSMGFANFFAHLAQGALPGGWYRRGLKDPFAAEIHIVLHDHGPIIESIRQNMLTTLRGGCSDESVPAVFPASAKADGLPGPNRCQLYQFAIFQ